MGFRHQFTHTLQVAFFQRGGGFEGTRIFGQDMADAFRNHRIQLMGNGIELGDFDIAQRRLLEETCAGLALFATGVVFAADQSTFKITVDDHHRDAFRHRDGLGS